MSGHETQPDVSLPSGTSSSCSILQDGLAEGSLHACMADTRAQHSTNSLALPGVWRRKTIVTVGGWKSRTTVEDMDLSLRTFVNGWKAIYLHDVTCLNEVGSEAQAAPCKWPGRSQSGVAALHCACACGSLTPDRPVFSSTPASLPG